MFTHPSPRVCISSHDGKVCARRWIVVLGDSIGWLLSRIAHICASQSLHPALSRAALRYFDNIRVSSQFLPVLIVLSPARPSLALCLLVLGLALVATGLLGLRAHHLSRSVSTSILYSFPNLRLFFWLSFCWIFVRNLSVRYWAIFLFVVIRNLMLWQPLSICSLCACVLRRL